jgi:hypothetical protein
LPRVGKPNATFCDFKPVAYREGFPHACPLSRGFMGSRPTTRPCCQQSRFLISRMGKGMVLPERIGLSTSPLPRECSTTELRQHWNLPVKSQGNARSLATGLASLQPPWQEDYGGSKVAYAEKGIRSSASRT